jgi:hypothetical protein
VVAHHKPSWPFPAEAERERQAVLAVEAIGMPLSESPVDGIWGSDHFGVVADLALPDEPVT